MIFTMIKKQALLLFRNPVELFLLLGLPIILITILGNALANLMEDGQVDLTFKLAVVQHQDENKQIESFIADLDDRNLPQAAVVPLQTAAENIRPVETFLEIIHSDELKEMIILEIVTPDALNEVQEDDDVSAIVEFPENFSYEFLSKALLEKDTDPKVSIHYKRGSEIAGNIVEQIMKTYQEEYTRGVFLGRNGIDPEQLHSLSTNFKQEISSISKYHPVTAKSYYTIGMVVMNVFFMAATIASYAFRERATNIFDRMIVANISRWIYFISVLLSGFIFSLFQALIVFGFSYVVFDVKFPDFRTFFIITLFFALAVGGIAVLLTAITYKMNSEQINGFFSGFVVTIFAFLGGSFFPVGEGTFLQKLGEFTPNGAAMSAYLSVMRGEAIADNIDHIIFIACFALVAVIIGAISFPKRGATS